MAPAWVLAVEDRAGHERHAVAAAGAYETTSHVEHSVWLRAGWMVPCWHGWHVGGDQESVLCPGSHSQALMVVAVGGAVLEAGHCLQSLMLEEPAADTCSTRTHCVHMRWVTSSPVSHA